MYVKCLMISQYFETYTYFTKENLAKHFSVYCLLSFLRKMYDYMKSILKYVFKTNVSSFINNSK